MTGLRSTTRFLVRVYCDANYYGTDCNTYCVARDDAGGHYRCDKDTGNKICLDGWIGPNCLTRKYCSWVFVRLCAWVIFFMNSDQFDQYIVPLTCMTLTIIG